METVRINITLPADWHEAFVEAASGQGQSLSARLRDADSSRRWSNSRARWGFVSPPRSVSMSSFGMNV
jgi:hypothetical protein